jgi:hypothetical protein
LVHSNVAAVTEDDFIVLVAVSIGAHAAHHVGLLLRFEQLLLLQLLLLEEELLLLLR